MQNFYKLIMICLFFHASISYADQYHYNNVVIGDRAIGLGGAYGAVADDASGVFYNPAGLAYALSNDVSGSANAFYSRKVTYKKAVGGKDFIENSKGTLPSFLGGLQKLDHILKGLVFAFGVYVTDGEAKDQNDVIEKVDLGVPTSCPKLGADGQPERDANGGIVRGTARNPIMLQRFHRTVNQRASTVHMGVGFAWRLRPNISLGLGGNYVTVDELVQEYQDVKTDITVCKKDGDFFDSTEQKTQNIRQQLGAYGLQPVFSTQAAFGRLSLGLTLKLGTYVSQSFDQALEARAATLLQTDQVEVDKGSTVAATSPYISQIDSTIKAKEKPLGSMSKEVRAAIAYFYSTRLLMTFDLIHHTAVTDAGDIPGVGKYYAKGAVTDFAGGLEYYLLPAFPLRVGYFTNNDSRPKIDKNKSGQLDHIDYNGESIFLAWVQPNSQIGAGFVLQQGKGEAQKLGGSLAVQNVEASSFTFAFSATHSF